MKSLIFAGSNASDSINQEVAQQLVNIVEDSEYIDLRKLDIAMYNRDMETNGIGFPVDIIMLHKKIKEYDRLIICTPEYNGDFSSFFKNILDWISRIDYLFLADKEIELICASTGKLGGPSVRMKGKDILQFLGAATVNDYAIKSYNHTDDIELLLRSFNL